MRAGRQKNTILVCFVFQRKTSHFQIFSYARGGLGGERGIYPRRLRDGHSLSSSFNCRRLQAAKLSSHGARVAGLNMARDKMS